MSNPDSWPVQTTETTDGLYGAYAFRSRADHRFWNCRDCDYAWTAVVDDFGNLVCVSTYENLRGY